MEQFPNHELQYVVDEYYDATDFADDNNSPRSGSSSMDEDSMDSDFEDDLELPRTDTSVLEARNGKDIQGIPWERLNFTREKYRESRLKQYKNYESLSRSRQDLQKQDILTHEAKKTLCIWSNRHKFPGCLAQTLSRVQISTMTVKDNLMVAGGFHGELICKNTTVSPDGKLLAVLGDSTECLIADPQSGKVLSSLKGHLDYSFASAWHPDGRILATGNQDTTCRLWDKRNLKESLAILKGRMGAIRAIKFTSDGRFMAMAEPADFVHVFDTWSDYTTGQEIDLFGEIGGISFSPDTDALFVGVSDRTYGSLLEFNRRRYDPYLDCIYYLNFGIWIHLVTKYNALCEWYFICVYFLFWP
ncbi:hypothetical protein DH2020_003454 [Rehmannia glutinosa]|uniref:WD repeat-containing protein n=1 Tax=Rehmannia glutinosa TaxID=99300 RepID=A0ABR0XLT2_REHGL